MRRVLRCCAAGHEGGWEAICLDLNIAVQGRSFDDVYHALNESVELYFETVSELSESERRQLLSRSAPLRVKLKFFWYGLRMLFGNDHDDKFHHQFTVPCAA